MKFYFKNNKLLIDFPNKNKGKFRYKQTRDSKLSSSFATKENKFNHNIYLEWQIGYDTLVSDVNKKLTRLKNKKFEFIGANGKKKYPYELSEFLWILIKEKIIKPITFQNLKKQIVNHNIFLNTAPQIEKIGSVVINNLEWTKAITKLPTYYHNNPDSTWIEIIIQKQQYASGVQSMIYFCVPIKAFLNGSELIGFSSTEKPMNMQYSIDKNNANNILNLFKALSMASPDHKKDVLAILTVLERG